MTWKTSENKWNRLKPILEKYIKEKSWQNIQFKEWKKYINIIINKFDILKICHIGIKKKIDFKKKFEEELEIEEENRTNGVK